MLGLDDDMKLGAVTLLEVNVVVLFFTRDAGKSLTMLTSKRCQIFPGIIGLVAPASKLA